MASKSKAKIKPSFPQYPFLTIFLTLKKYHANKYTILNFNRIIRLYRNVYDYAICTLNYYEDKYFISLFVHFKHTGKYIITAHIPKYMHDQNIYLTFTFYLCTLLWIFKCWKYIFAGDILAINNLLTK